MRAAAMALVVAVAGCTPVERAFHCADSAQCVNDTLQGTCEATSWCSFPDTACASGRRYGGFAGDGLGGACVMAADSCGTIGEACCTGDSCQAGLACVSGACVGCVAQLAIGNGHGCALGRNGQVACWGKNDHGQLGNGGTSDAAAAVTVVDDHGVPLSGLTAVVAGAAHSCALRSDHTVFCWGDNSAGQLGRGGVSMAVNAVPAQVGLTSVVALAAGGRHSCAALSTGAVWCWGANDSGQLGVAPSAGATMPIEVVDRAGLPLDAVALAAGDTHSCAIERDKTLRCWGSDQNGELGDGASAVTSLPVAATVLGAHVVAVAAGAHFSCALGEDQYVFCFGLDDRGQAGQVPGTAVPVPTPVSIDSATAVSAGAAHACTRRAGGQLSCWGDGSTVAVVRQGVGPIGAGAGDICSARVDGVDCATFGDPHLVCP